MRGQRSELDGPLTDRATLAAAALELPNGKAFNHAAIASMPRHRRPRSPVAALGAHLMQNHFDIVFAGQLSAVEMTHYTYPIITYGIRGISDLIFQRTAMERKFLSSGLSRNDPPQSSILSPTLSPSSLSWPPVRVGNPIISTPPIGPAHTITQQRDGAARRTDCRQRQERKTVRDG